MFFALLFVCGFRLKFDIKLMDVGKIGGSCYVVSDLY